MPREFMTYEERMQLARDLKSKLQALFLGNLRFADATSPEISVMEAMFVDPEDPDVMNDNDWSIHKIIGKKKLRIPVMVMMGTKSPWTMEADMKTVASSVGRASIVKFPTCGECPFMFQPYKFTQSFSKMFKKAKVKKKRKKGNP